MDMHRICRLISLSCLLVFLSSSPLEAADPEEPQRRSLKESSFITGIGAGRVAEGNYQPILLIWHLGLDMQKYFPRLGKHRGSLSLFMEPQFNVAADPEAAFEIGISPGLQYRYPFTEKLSGYLLASIGPHYISLVTRDQQNGFIFSDVVGGGLYYYLNARSALNLGYRFRHLSNADLALPNNGVNTHFITFGYAAFF